MSLKRNKDYLCELKENEEVLREQERIEKELLDISRSQRGAATRLWQKTNGDFSDDQQDKYNSYQEAANLADKDRKYVSNEILKSLWRS